MTSAFSWQNSLPCFIPHSKAKFACYSRCFLTSYFCILVPYDERYILKKSLFFGVSSRRSCRSSQICSMSASLDQQLGIDLDYCDTEQFALEMNRDYSVVFEISPKYCTFDSSVVYDDHFISSKGFLPTVVDIMVIWIKFTHSGSFQFTDS